MRTRSPHGGVSEVVLPAPGPAAGPPTGDEPLTRDELWNARVLLRDPKALYGPPPRATRSWLLPLLGLAAIVVVLLVLDAHGLLAASGQWVLGLTGAAVGAIWFTADEVRTLRRHRRALVREQALAARLPEPHTDRHGTAGRIRRSTVVGLGAFVALISLAATVVVWPHARVEGRALLLAGFAAAGWVTATAASTARACAATPTLAWDGPTREDDERLRRAALAVAVRSGARSVLVVAWVAWVLALGAGGYDEVPSEYMVSSLGCLAGLWIVDLVDRRLRVGLDRIEYLRFFPRPGAPRP